MTLSDLPEIPRVSKFAYASIAFALVHLVCLPFPYVGGALAIYCGFQARKAIRASGGKMQGTAIANWGIVLGLGGFVWVTIPVLLLAPAVQLVDEMDRIHGIVSEFKEAYAKNDAPGIHAKLTDQGKEKMSVEELSKQLEMAAKTYGTFDDFSFRWWAFSNQTPNEKERITRFPYELKGPKGKFLGAFYCRKLDDGTWRLERFEFEYE